LKKKKEYLFIFRNIYLYRNVNIFAWLYSLNMLMAHLSTLSVISHIIKLLFFDEVNVRIY
jgi:hypothetical protein